jgi:hypothetical protein
MIVDLSFLGSELVISAALAFIAGLASVMVYAKARSALAEHHYRADEAVVEAVILEYTRRLRDYDKVIAELRTKVDIMEMRAQQPQNLTSQYQQVSHQSQPHAAATSEKENNGTTDYILKLLAERPRSSREVQLAVGRTREHTARLMKKLHDSRLVSREANAKPFRYNITDAGRERLKEKVAPAAV